MSGKITVDAAIVVENGPQISFNQTIEVEAYDKVEVKVPFDTSEKCVEVQPGTSSGLVLFLLIVSDWYGDDLTYKVNSSSSSTRVVKLDQPQLLTGNGGVSILNGAPQKLYITNSNHEKDVNIQILVGRDATP